MRVLRVIASPEQPRPTEDGGDTGIVVAADDGEQFTLVVDEALMTACAIEATTSEDTTDSIAAAVDDRAPAPHEDSPSEPPARVAAPLTPRDIQTRIRAGEAPEDLAAEAGMDYDRLMRFGFAVMQERSRVGDEARRARARRDGDGALVPFGETVDRRFSAAGIDPADVRWDAFRRADGSWTISAIWDSDGTDRQAYWSFALAARTVLPADEAAADLLSDRPLRAVVQAVPDSENAADSSQDGRDELFDQEDPAGYVRPTGPRAVPFPPPAAAPTAAVPAAAVPADPVATDEYGTAPLPLRLADAPVDRPPSPIRLVPAASGRDEPDVGSSSAPAAAGSAMENGSINEAAGPTAVANQNVEQDATEAGEPASPLDLLFGAAEGETAHEDEPTGQNKPRRRTGRDRAKVPSWEDIYLGVKRKD